MLHVLCWILSWSETETKVSAVDTTTTLEGSEEPELKVAWVNVVICTFLSTTVSLRYVGLAGASFSTAQIVYIPVKRITSVIS